MIRRLLACAVLAALSWVFFILAGRALCYIAIRQIGELTNTKIRTASVDFRTNGSVLIRNLVIRPDQEQEWDDAILDAGMVFARFSLGSLLRLRPRLKTIDVNDFVVNAQYDRDTHQWNIAALKITPPKGGPGRMPRVRLNAGTLQYSKISKGQAEVAVSVPLNARFELDEETQRSYSFEITTATMASGHGKSRLTGSWKPGSIMVTGGISSMDVPELEMAWIIDVLAAELKYDQSNAFSLKMKIRDLQSKRSPALERLTLVGPAFLESSGPFAALQKFFHRYEPRGRVDIELEASGNLDRLGESTLAGEVYCKDVAICHHKFQYPIEHLTGRVGFTESSVTLSNLFGRHGGAELFFNGWCRDFGPDRKYQVQIRSDNMPLDDDLYNALGAKQQEFWCAFSPTGLAAIDYWFTRESQTNRREKLDVELRGAGAVYQRFPYPLENLSGKLSFEGNQVEFSDIVSKVNERQITVNGQIITHSIDKPMYDILVDVNNMPLDATLEAALPEKQKTLYARCHPEGLADGWIRIATQDAGPASFVADLSFKDASLKFDQLPFSVSGISARAAFTPNLITVKEFSGRHGDGLMSLTGQIQPAQEQGKSLYHLAISMEQAVLNDDLFNLLPDSLKKTVSDLKPDGRVDLTAHVAKESPAEYPDYDIALECFGNSMTVPNLPYPLEDITGSLTLDANRIELKDMAANLGHSFSTIETEATVKLSGEIALAGGAFGSARLALSASNVPFDDQFALALPQRVRPSYDRLSPTGLFDLDFNNIRLTRTPKGKKSIEFDGDVTLRNCGFNMSGSRIRLGTTLATEGLYETGEGFLSCRAVLNGGTMVVQGKSLANLRADVSYDPDSRSWSTEDLVADFYDGKLSGKLHVQELAEQAGQYTLQTGFVDVDLKQFLSDTELEQTPKNGHSSGKMNGSLCVSARAGDDSSRVGTCKLSISDMQVGKLSPLAKLLQVLQLTEPKDYAFNQMLLDAYIRQDGLLVRKLDMSGQNIAFFGSGRMDLQDRSVDLTLTARGRRLATDAPSVLQSLTEGLGQAVVRMSVSGDLYDPKVKTETLPVIEGTLQILGARPATRN